MSMCRVFSCVVGRGYLLWPVHSLGKTLLAFVLLHSVLQGQICWLFQVSLDFLLLHSSPLWWKGHLFLVLVLEGLVGHHRTVQLSFRLQTEPDLPLSVWVSPAESVTGTGAPAAADLGHPVCGISPLGGGCPTIEPLSRWPTNCRTIIAKKFSHC